MELTHPPATSESESGETTPEGETVPEGMPQIGRDMMILRSLPGVGDTVLAILIAEAYSLIKTRNLLALRCLCGVAPVTKRSGKSWIVTRRKSSHERLINALYHWSRVAVQRDPICKAKYKALRKRGHTHGRALRSIADRLLSCACAMLRDGTLYDPNRTRVAA